ncbi:MAG: FAD-dependent oxidoreductase [Leucobacter sp.]
MTNHQHAPHHDHWHDLAGVDIERLEREAALAAPLRDTLIQEAAAALDAPPWSILEIGSGVGADAAALAARFPTARVHALDVSDTLLEQVRRTARASGVDGRVITHEADLNHDWSTEIPQTTDLVWASLSLHHLSKPADTLKRVFDSLRPGGVFVLSEVTDGVHLTPDDLGTGHVGFAERIAPTLSAPAEYSSIDWATLLAGAGFTSVTRTEHPFLVQADTADGARYLELHLRTLRDHIAAGAADEELAAYDAAIEALAAKSSKISFSSTRAVWIAVRGDADGDIAPPPGESLEADVAVLGGGSAGLAASIALARSRRNVAVIDAGEPRNAPADGAHNLLGQEGVSPLELLARGRAEAESYGVQILPGRVTGIAGTIDDFTVEVDAGAQQVRARRLILATGLVDDLPDIPGVAEGWGKSVLHCPFCHGWEVRDQRIAILTRGEVAVHHALLFGQLSDQVTVFLHDAPDPSEEQLEQLEALGVSLVRPKVERLVMEGTQVRGVELEDGQIREADAAVVLPRFNARTDLFESLGGAAEATPFGTQIPADARGMTIVPGVWAAGNSSNPMAMVVAAAASGVAVGAAVHGDLAMADLNQAVEALHRGH